MWHMYKARQANGLNCGLDRLANRNGGDSICSAPFDLVGSIYLQVGVGLF